MWNCPLYPCFRCTVGGGEVIWAMPKRKHFFFQEGFPYIYIYIYKLTERPVVLSNAIFELSSSIGKEWPPMISTLQCRHLGLISTSCPLPPFLDICVEMIQSKVGNTNRLRRLAVLSCRSLLHTLLCGTAALPPLVHHANGLDCARGGDFAS